AEALGVLLHQLSHLLLRHIESIDQLGILAAERPAIFGDVIADLIVLEVDAARVAGHARDAGLHGAVGPLGIADDGRRPLVLSHVVGVDKHVTVQAVGQVEDDLAGGVLETVLAEAGSERISEEVAAVGQEDVALDEILRYRLEIVGAPVSAVLSVVPLKYAV